MIVKSKELIPAIYSESYDMSVFTGLLDLLYTGRTLNDLRAKVSHCPQHCFKGDIAHLASLLGFGEEATRDVLTSYRSLVKRKGTEDVLMSLISYAYGCVWPEREPYKEYGWLVVADGHITAYVDIKDERATLFLKLVKKLAPVGVFIQVRPLAELPNKTTE